jgi:hypothetical protein
MRGKLDPLKEPIKCPPRGEITGFTSKAARRLKRAFMELYVPNRVLWSFSLTTHAVFTPDQWRGAMKRFRCGLVKRGWAAIWRVELQRRQAPHLHCAFWLPQGDGLNDVRLLWLRCTRELDDEAARAHAVKGDPIKQGDGGWAAYMGMHSGKHKEEQLGWLGKQWGLWNVSAFAVREPVRATLNSKEHSRFLRCVRRLETAERRRHFLRLKMEALSMAQRFPIAAAAFDRKVARMRGRLRVPVMHSRMIRLMKGSTAVRILDWCKGAGVESTPDRPQAVAQSLGTPF